MPQTRYLFCLRSTNLRRETISAPQGTCRATAARLSRSTEAGVRGAKRELLWITGSGRCYPRAATSHAAAAAPRSVMKSVH
jgi:hypothetical protein